jgi:hypothetical protein
MAEAAAAAIVFASLFIGFLMGRLSTTPKPDDVDPVSGTSTPPYHGRTYVEGPRMPRDRRKARW